MTDDDDTPATERTDGLTWTTLATVTKYVDAEAAQSGLPYAIEDYPGNAGLNEGLIELWQLITGLGGVVFGATALLGVGTSSTAVTPSTDTDLLGTATYVTVSAAPTTTTPSCTWSASFPAGTGTGVWAEWSLKNTGGKNMNRAVSAMGTKGAGEVWTLTATLTLT